MYGSQPLTRADERYVLHRYEGSATRNRQLRVVSARPGHARLLTLSICARIVCCLEQRLRYNLSAYLSTYIHVCTCHPADPSRSPRLASGYPVNCTWEYRHAPSSVAAINTIPSSAKHQRPYQLRTRGTNRQRRRTTTLVSADYHQSAIRLTAHQA